MFALLKSKCCLPGHVVFTHSHDNWKGGSDFLSAIEIDPDILQAGVGQNRLRAALAAETAQFDAAKWDFKPERCGPIDRNVANIQPASH